MAGVVYVDCMRKRNGIEMQFDSYSCIGESRRWTQRSSSSRRHQTQTQTQTLNWRSRLIFQLQLLCIQRSLSRLNSSNWGNKGDQVCVRDPRIRKAYKPLTNLSILFLASMALLPVIVSDRTLFSKMSVLVFRHCDKRFTVTVMGSLPRGELIPTVTQ